MFYFEEAIAAQEGSSADNLVDEALDHEDDDYLFHPRDTDAVQLAAGRAKRHELERLFCNSQRK
jgi:hypothetical protein